MPLACHRRGAVSAWIEAGPLGSGTGGPAMNRAKTRVRVAVILAAMGMPCGMAHAQVTWTGSAGDGNWYTAQNWSSGAVPPPEASVLIPQGFPGVSASGAFVNSLLALSPLSVGTGG